MSRTVSTGQKGSKTTYNCPKLSAAVILRLQVAPWGDYLKYVQVWRFVRAVSDWDTDNV